MSGIGKLMAVGAALCSVSLLAGCPAGDGQGQSGEPKNGAGSPAIGISALAPSNTQATDNLEVTSTPTDDGFDVVVRAGEEFPRVQQLFASLDFGDASLTPGNIAVDANSEHVLGAAFPSGPNTLELGLVPIGAPDTDLVKPGDTLLTFSLKHLGGEGKVASNAAQPVTARARNLELINEAGEWVLNWDYTNPGDSNQDGEVGINDLKEIGEHFRETLSDLQHDPLRHVDADANGEINLGDISSIGSNMKAQLYAYNIEMSPDAVAPFNTVGQLVLNEERSGAPAGETLRFDYRFVGQYVPNAWYRVVPVVNNPAGGVLTGTPSEAVSEDGRQLAGVTVEIGGKKTVVVCAAGLPQPLTHVTGCRVVFPSGYKYVPESFNVGSVGGGRSTPDGIWASFATSFILAPEAFLEPVVLEDGRQAIDFNVTVAVKNALASPVGYGDLFNFQLEKVSGGTLDLSFELGNPSGVKRTYYSQEIDGNGNSTEHFFGNAIGFKVN